MNTQNHIDQAYIFAVAFSLWEALWQKAEADRLCLGYVFAGGDEQMRAMMRISTHFNEWSQTHVAIDDINDIWPYMLADKFGKACLAAMPISDLPAFNDSHCQRVGELMNLPLIKS